MNYRMSVSMFKAFLSCPARAMALYHGRVLGDSNVKPTWEDPGSRAMACGCLLDAMVTRHYCPDVSEKVTVDGIFRNFESSYDDGRKNAAFLVNKSGGWNAYALHTIAAGQRLLDDAEVKEFLIGAAGQVKVRFELGGFDWSGDIDLLNVIDGTLWITDLKHPASIEDGWIYVAGRNVKAPWQDVWGYWFQLAAYRYGAIMGTLDGVPPVNVGAYDEIKQGILYATNSDPSQIGYIPVSNQVDAFVSVTSKRTLDGREPKLDAIRAIVEGKRTAGRCEKCDYCKETSRVEIPLVDNDKIPPPVFSDDWGVNWTEV